MPTGWLKFVTNFPSLGSPDWTVTCILSNQSVGYLMKDDLLDLLDAAVFNQVATDGNSTSPKVTLTSAIDCSVKSERVID